MSFSQFRIDGAPHGIPTTHKTMYRPSGNNSLRQALARLVIIKRPSSFDDDSRSPRSVAAYIGHRVFGPAKSWLFSLYHEDDLNVTGFHPARMLRVVIAICIISQNALGMSIVRDGGVREALRRSGQLACANLLPLALLAFPDLGITRLVSQPGPQIVWAHALFGWMIWYEVLVRAGLSAFSLSGPRKHTYAPKSFSARTTRALNTNSITIPPISPEQLTFYQSAQRPVTRRGKQAAYTPSLGSTSTMVRQAEEEAFHGSSPRYNIYARRSTPSPLTQTSP